MKSAIAYSNLNKLMQCQCPCLLIYTAEAIAKKHYFKILQQIIYPQRIALSSHFINTVHLSLLEWIAFWLT